MSFFEKLKETAELLASKRLLLRQMAFLLLALGLLAYYLCSLATKAGKIEKQEPAYVALKCSKCGFCADMRVYTLQDDNPVCEECGGRMGYRMKCHDCEFEFAFFPENYDTIKPIKGQKREDSAVTLLNNSQCPNCNGPRTYHIMPKKRDPKNNSDPNPKPPAKEEEKSQ